MNVTEYKEQQLATLDKVRKMQAEMLERAQEHIQSWFHQGGGVSAKMVFFPAGTQVVGGMHRFENMNIMVCGDMELVTDGGIKRLTVTNEPLFFVSPAGTKRAANVFQDTYWISIVPCDNKTVEEVTEEFIVPEHEEQEFLKLLGS